MARSKPDINVSPTEMDLLEFLWQHKRPMTAPEIKELGVNRKWAPRSLHIFLNSLMDKKLVEVAGSINLLRIKARLYRTTISRDEFLKLQCRDYISENLDGSINTVMMALADTKKNRDDEFVKEIEEWLLQYKNNLSSKKRK